MSDIDNYLEANYGEGKAKEAPCCGASNPQDHDFECRFRGTQINLPEWEKPIKDLPKDRPQYISRGFAPDAKDNAEQLYGAAEAERMFPDVSDDEAGEVDEDGDYVMELLDLVRVIQRSPQPDHTIQLVHIHGEDVFCPTCGNCDHSQKMDCPICGSYPLVILTKITITEHGDSVDTVTAHLVES